MTAHATRSRPPWAWLGLLLAVPWLAVAASVDVPFLSGRVVDAAEIMRAPTREALVATLKAHEDRTSNQVVVLTLPTIGEESIEDFAVRAFEAWKLGQKGKDNGVLMVVVPNDRKLRIEVGYGLEGTLTDAAASRIIRNLMTPAFKAGDYDGGIKAGAEAVVATLDGQAPAAVDESEPSAAHGFTMEGPEIGWPLRILLGAFIFGIIGLFTFIGIMTPGVGWFLYFFLIPFWAMFPLVVVGPRGALVLLAIYVVGYPITKLVLRRSAWYRKAAHELKTKGHSSIGGFAIATGSSGHSSSSSSSGGFSGGGGSSGGGGASGSW